MEDSEDVHSISNNISANFNLTGILNLKASLLNLQLLRKTGHELKVWYLVVQGEPWKMWISGHNLELSAESFCILTWTQTPGPRATWEVTFFILPGLADLQTDFLLLLE